MLNLLQDLLAHMGYFILRVLKVDRGRIHRLNREAALASRLHGGEEGMVHRRGHAQTVRRPELQELVEQLDRGGRRAR